VGTRGPNLGTYIAEGVERERETELWERGGGVLGERAAFAAQEGAGLVALQWCVSFREAHGGVVNLNCLHSAWAVSSLSIFGFGESTPNA
jgi:hypothetical protein